MAFSDERDYAEEEYNRVEAAREAREEEEYERLENLGLIPEEHKHDCARSLISRQFDCAECHDYEKCEQAFCLFCPW